MNTVHPAQDMLLQDYLKRLRLPTVAQNYERFAQDAATSGQTYLHYLLALLREEVKQREHNRINLRIRQARFPVLKELSTFDFKEVPSLNKVQVLELAEGGYIDRHEVILAIGNPGTGKTHLITALGLAACRQGRVVRFYTATALVNELIEAHHEHRLQRLEKQLLNTDLLIIDELGYVPFSELGAQLLFVMCSARYERRATAITTNLPFAEWTQVFGNPKLTAALLDRLTHYAHILQMSSSSFRFKQSLARQEHAALLPGKELAQPASSE
jgi:DNA replication protein DnaC